MKNKLCILTLSLLFLFASCANPTTTGRTLEEAKSILAEIESIDTGTSLDEAYGVLGIDIALYDGFFCYYQKDSNGNLKEYRSETDPFGKISNSTYFYNIYDFEDILLQSVEWENVLNSHTRVKHISLYSYEENGDKKVVYYYYPDYVKDYMIHNYTLYRNDKPCAQVIYDHTQFEYPRKEILIYEKNQNEDSEPLIFARYLCNDFGFPESYTLYTYDAESREVRTDTYDMDDVLQSYTIKSYDNETGNCLITETFDAAGNKIS